MSELEPKEKVEPSLNFNLSDRSKNILDLAAEEVDKIQGITYIRPEILLAALLTDEKVSEILSNQSVETTTVQKNLKNLIKPSTKKTTDENRIKDPTSRITNNTREALFLARDIAVLAKRETDPQDIFMGICQIGDSYATVILLESGFNVSRFIESRTISATPSNLVFETPQQEI